jgi:hypothetical protein
MAIEKVLRNGPYAPLSATYYQDDDIAEAGEAAELLYLRGLAFCAGRPSDGFMSDSQVVRFVAIGLTDVQQRADRLVDVGLWERVDGGYVIRAWLKWNKSAEELGQYRAQDRDRKRSQPVTKNVRAESETTESEAKSEAERNSQNGQYGIPRGDGAESARTTEAAPEVATKPDIRAVDIPRGLRSDSDTHYTSLHDTSLHDTHTLSPASRSDESEVIPFAGRRTRSPTNRRRSDNAIDTDPQFVAFWAAYPRKVDKGHARKAWQAKVNAGVDPKLIADGAARYRDDPRRPSQERFIPHPSTWINGERWTDIAGTTSAPKAATASGGSWWEN